MATIEELAVRYVRAKSELKATEAWASLSVLMIDPNEMKNAILSATEAEASAYVALREAAIASDTEAREIARSEDQLTGLLEEKRGRQPYVKQAEWRS